MQLLVLGCKKLLPNCLEIHHYIATSKNIGLLKTSGILITCNMHYIIRFQN